MGLFTRLEQITASLHEFYVDIKSERSVTITLTCHAEVRFATLSMTTDRPDMI